MIVDIIEARNLPKMDVIGSCDPYCKVWLSTRPTFVQQTKIVKQSKVPVWNESFSFSFEASSLSVATLNIDVFDWDRVSSDDLISNLSISLAKEAQEKRDSDGTWYVLPRDKEPSDPSKPPQIKLRITVKIDAAPVAIMA